MFVLIEDFKHLTMSVFSKACVRFKNTEHFYPGANMKTKHRFEYNERLRELLWGATDKHKDFDPLWNKMCKRIITTMIIMRHTIKL